MNPSEIQAMMLKIFQETDLNTVHLPEEDIDIPILEEPLMAVAAADDPLFAELKKPEAISPDWMAPQEWLPEAKSVIVFFFPYSEDVRRRAAASDEPINEAWQYGYPAGSQVSKDLTAVLQKELEAAGIVVSNPIADPRFVSKRVPVKTAGEDDLHFTPTWSTRHAGYIAGLGTFGIHRHMITEKGCCGALTTLILDTFVEPTERKYTGLYDNCIKCGLCAVRCPAEAITIENLRNLKKCSEYGGWMREQFNSSACGKCMVAVPCEHTNPAATE